MSGLNGRRGGVNISQYIANLNTTESTPPNEDFLASQDDLSLFATTDFFDFDMGEGLPNIPRANDFDVNPSDQKSGTASWQDPSNSASQDFLNSTSIFVQLFVYRCISLLFLITFLP